MEFSEYQKEAKKTAQYPSIGEKYIYPVLGLTGEAGEVADKVKKIFRNDGGRLTPKKIKELKSELGDVLWYLSQTATELNLSLNDIAKENLTKLFSRKQRGKIASDGDNR